MGAHSAKINDRNDQLSLLQDDSWTATDKPAQLSPLEVQRENPNPSRLYQLPAVISRVVRGCSSPSLTGAMGVGTCFKPQNYSANAEHPYVYAAVSDRV